MNAIEFIEDEVPDELDIDANDDGYVDNVTFLVKGSPGAWADLLWPHRWALYSFDVFINDSLYSSIVLLTAFLMASGLFSIINFPF